MGFVVGYGIRVEVGMTDVDADRSGSLDVGDKETDSDLGVIGLFSLVIQPCKRIINPRINKLVIQFMVFDKNDLFILTLSLLFWN
jgi:hypothetical protein